MVHKYVIRKRAPELPRTPMWTLRDLADHTGTLHGSIRTRLSKTPMELRPVARRSVRNVQYYAKPELFAWFEQNKQHIRKNAT